MNISNLNSIVSPQNLDSLNKISAGVTDNSGGNFGSLVKDAVESIDGTQKSADQEIAKAVKGESPDLHRTIIALQTADLKFQLGLQVRNKLIGAYEEIMRMQV
jgi:flagellar hook-basal body complex protein FliE